MSALPRSFATLALIVVLALAGASACGSKSTSSTAGAGVATTSQTSLPKTKFLLHAGLAFGAFHHFIYKPFKAGKLTSGGLLRHKLNLVKAGLAGAFAYHEIKLALTDAQSSPLLRRLLSPLTALAAKLQALGSAVRGGDTSGVAAANTQVSLVGAASHAAGATVNDATPSASQLTGG